MSMRCASNTMQLERDPSNHPVYLVSCYGPVPLRCNLDVALSALWQGTSDQAGLMSRREEARLARIKRKHAKDLFDDAAD